MAEKEQPARPKRQPTKEALLANGPWLPPPWELADAAALQALVRGDAAPDQQRRAVKWLVEVCCGIYDVSYRPGAEDGRRDTDFAEGRRFVGLQVVKLTRLDLAKIRRTEPNADQTEPKS